MKFNWDNIVFQMLGKLVDCVWVSILWVICCIPVFTIGASTTALYYTVHKSIRGDRGYTTRTFFGAFRDNFKAATLPYLIWLAVMIILGCDAYITYQVLKTGSMKGAFFYFFLIMIAVAIMWSAFLFPYIARFENGIFATLRNADIEKCISADDKASAMGIAAAGDFSCIGFIGLYHTGIACGDSGSCIDCI